MIATARTRARLRTVVASATPRWLHPLMGSTLVRFGLVGVVATALQLGLLHAEIAAGMHPVAANATAFLASTQANFVLSSVFTWRHRPTSAPWWRRWWRFNATASVVLGLNSAVFAALHVMGLDPTPAAISATACSTGVSYLISRLVIFVAPAVAEAPADDPLEESVPTPVAAALLAAEPQGERA